MPDSNQILKNKALRQIVPTFMGGVRQQVIDVAGLDTFDELVYGSDPQKDSLKQPDCEIHFSPLDIFATPLTEDKSIALFKPSRRMQA